MQRLLSFLVFGTIVFAHNVSSSSEQNFAYGYMKNIGIPLAEKIRETEEASSRIIGGVPAAQGQYPFLAGIFGDIDLGGTAAVSVCGGALISPTKVLTAAHCWNDGVYQVWRFTVVLGSVYLFTGGVRIQTSAVAVHPNWNPALVRNDVAVAYFIDPVPLSDLIAPIALPSGSEISESFAGQRAIAIGFGVTENDGTIGIDQVLNHVGVNVIGNSECYLAYPFVIQSSNVCTSSLGGVGFCHGDTGGPLIVNKDNGPLLIGVASFGSALGCESSIPKAYARVTSFLDFINRHV